MSKNLIISKLNKCQAYEYGRGKKPQQDSTSQISTSTKTQQSPTLFQLNPEFTFKASDLKQIIPVKSKAHQFFDNFDASNQVIYQKAILKKPKVMERCLEFQLMNLYRQGQRVEEISAIKKLQFLQEQERKIQKSPSAKTIEVQQQTYKRPECVKTQYTQNPQPLQFSQDQYKMCFKGGIPYDSKKYKMHRQKQSLSKQLYLRAQPQRCHTEVDNQLHCQPLPNYLSNTYLQQSQNLPADLKDYQFKSIQMKQYQQDKQDFFSQYFFNDGAKQQCETNHRNEMNNQFAGCQLTKRQGNSSRLSFFRKERQHQMRKSLLQRFNDNSRSYKCCSYDNKENTNNYSKFVPSRVLKNFSQAQKKLQTQFSQRNLLDRRNLQQQPNQKLSYLVPKKQSPFMSKEGETRIQSIRKQLKQIYQVQEKDRSRLKITRGQQDIYDNNSRNSLRRVGSIYRF